VKKLTLFLVNRIAWSSLLKALALTLLVAIAAASSFAWWSLAMLLAGFAAMYVSQLPERKGVRVSYWLTALFGVTGMGILGSSGLGADHPWVLGFALFSFAAAEFLVIGLMNLVFKQRNAVYSTLQTILLLAVFLAFFGLNQPRFVTLSFLVQVFPLVAFLSIFFLVREAALLSGALWPRRAIALAGLVGLASIETATVALFLPFGALNAAVFLALIVSLLRDLVIAHLRGEYSATLFLKELAVFTVVSVLIFALSRWSI
jgi:hypothetical protein